MDTKASGYGHQGPSGRQMTRTPSHQPSGGKRYYIKANCYPMRYNPKLIFYHYQGIDPDVRPINRRREILRKVQVEAFPHVFGTNNVVGYDGKAALFTTMKLRFDSQGHNQTQGILPVNMSSAGPQGHQPPNYQVTLKLVGELLSGSIGSLLNNDEPEDNSFTINQIINVFLLHSATSNHARTRSHRQTKSRMFLDPGERGSKFGGFELWNGYFMNARPSRGRLLLNLDTTVALMYERGDLIELCRKLLDLEVNNVRGIADGGYATRLKSSLRNLRVRQEKVGRVGKIRTITDLVPRAGAHEFHDRNGETTTVGAYYLQTYNYRLLFPLLPGIKSKRGDVVPFELLSVVEGQMYRRQLDPMLQAAMLKASSKPPGAKFREIEAGLAEFNQGVLGSAGLSVSNSCVIIPARILDPPAIVFSGDTKSKLDPRAGAWDLHKAGKGFEFHKPCTVEKLALANFDPTIEPHARDAFGKKLLLTLKERGVTINCELGKSLIASNLNPSGDIGNQLQELVGRIERNFPSKGFLLLVILPSKGSDIRRTIKRLGDVTVGFASQCLMAREAIVEKRPAYILNVAMKINARMGGINSVPDKGGIEWVASLPTMIVGADVSHPPPGTMRPSIASIAFSVDKDASVYSALTRIQEPRVEKIEDLENMMKEALRSFGEYNKDEGTGKHVLPARIVFYRDGVSEGEYQTLADAEFNMINNAIGSYYGELYKTDRGGYIFPKKSSVPVTFIVVGKRHHVQFFPHDPSHPDNLRNGNCPPGMVVDTDDISHPYLTDFYLMSHAAIQGTSRPAHYIVIKDQNNFRLDELQELSYALCHNYAVATRSVSIPAPVFYADRVCKRLAIHLRDEDLSSETGVGEEVNEEFMQKWHDRFRLPHKSQLEGMYFV